MTTLPANWRHTTLGALGHYWNGRGFKKSEWRQSGRPIIRIQNLTGSRTEFNYYDGEAEEHYIARRGDLLISWAATLGAYIWDGPEAVVNQHIFKVESLIDRRLHKYLLDFKLDELARRAHGSGMVHVTRQTFDSLPVMVPESADEQRKIVELLEDHLSRLDAANDYLVSAARRQTSLTRAWTAANVEGEGTLTPLAEIVLETKTGWDRRRDFTVAAPEGHPYLKMNQVNFDGRLDLSAVTHVKGAPTEADRYRVRTGDVLFNNRNSRELVGKTATVDERANGYTYNNNLVRMRFSKEVIPAFAVMQMNSPAFRGRVGDSISASTNVAAIYTRDLLRQAIWVPDLSHQAVLVARFSDIDGGCSRLNSSLSDLKERKSRLMRALLSATFSGQLVGDSNPTALTEEMAGV